MNHRYSYCKREAEEREEAQRGAGAKTGGPEPTGLLMRRTYLHELEPAGYSDPDPDEQQEDAERVCGSTERKMDVDRQTDEEVKDRQDGGISEEEEEKQEEEGRGTTPVDFMT